MEAITRIDTELWWYMICDYDEYVQRGGKIKRDYNEACVIEVPNGKYQITHYEHRRDPCIPWGNVGAIYAHIERIDN